MGAASCAGWTAGGAARTVELVKHAAVVVALASMLAASGCASSGPPADAVPGASLDGPNVVRYPLGPYTFKNARKELHQGFREGDGCGMAGEAVTRPGEPPVQEIVIAEDPETCRFLVVTGEPGER